MYLLNKQKEKKKEILNISLIYIRKKNYLKKERSAQIK